MHSRLLAHLQNLLAEIGAAPATPLADLRLLSAAERHQIVVECNAEAVAPAPDHCLHELVAEQAERTPEAVAVDSAVEPGDSPGMAARCDQRDSRTVSTQLRVATYPR